jgi:LacI family transcriptional regulator
MPTDDARPRPTMREVAALAGVSLKTVSRVVNGEPGVSGDLTDRVQLAAQRLDYQPNLTASSLRRNDGKTKTIGLLLENVANPFSSALHRAVEDVARPRGVVVFAGSLDEDHARERELAKAFSSRRVDGLIVVPAGHDQSYLTSERRAGTAMVFVDRPPTLLDADAVLTANTAGARSAVAHLVKHGHRRIGYLGDLAQIATAVERYAGYCEALDRAGIPVDPALVRHDLHASDQAQTAFAQMLMAPEPPTAVFASQNLITIGAIRALRMLGVHEKVALVGFDEILLADLLQPAVTLVVQDVTAMGVLAAELLFARLDGDDGPSQRHVLGTQLVERGSGEIRGPAA